MAYVNGSPMTSRTISAGKTGTVTINGQGKILSAVNPNNSGDNGIWTINSGIAGYTLGQYDSKQWAAVVGGTVTLPVAEGILQQDLTPPKNAQSDRWNSLTVNSNGNLTLGAENQDGNSQAAAFRVGGTGSYVYNYGSVTVNNINQYGDYPVVWNNYPGSDLTIAEGATLGIWQEDLTNFAPEKGQSDSPGEVTLNGTLNFMNSGSIQNSGTLDIGPIGTVATVTQNTGAPTGGELTNYAGGTVTSQNPCYYGEEIFSK